MTEEGETRGRPSGYNQELADKICEALSQGTSLRKICRADDMPGESTVRQWASNDVEGFYAQYTRARDIGLDCVADEVFEIADDGSDHQRDRLRFDARRWYLSKLAPKRYGDKLTTELTGADGGPVKTEAVVDWSKMSTEALREFQEAFASGRDK